MRAIYFLLICSVVALSSCSSAYKSGQTPDDVYYSPSNQRISASATNDNSQDEYYNANPSDQYLAMKVQDPARWSTFDNYDYGYAGGYSNYGTYGMYGGYMPWTMSFGFWNPYYNYMNSYYMWNGFYNPYYYGGFIGGPKYVGYNYSSYAQARPFNRAAYNSRPVNVSSTRTATRFYGPANNSVNSQYRRYNTRNGYISNPNSNYRPAQQNFQPSRSYAPSPSSFGSGSGGGRSFSRPGRG